MYSIYLYRNRKMKLVEIVLRRGRRRCGRKMEGMSLTKVHCKHIWKSHNEMPLYNWYVLTKNVKIMTDQYSFVLIQHMKELLLKYQVYVGIVWVDYSFIHSHRKPTWVHLESKIMWHKIKYLEHNLKQQITIFSARI
jgi:hypothetical protein